jgi:lipopolysaccharide transport system permease protein
MQLPADRSRRASRHSYAAAMTTTGAEAAVGLPLEPPSPPRRSLVRETVAELRAVRRYSHLLRYLVASSLRTENANTVLGFVWWILDPLLLMATYVMLVTLIRRGTEPDFPVFVLTGIIAFELFSKATRSAVGTTVRQEKSMRQVAFPKTVLPLAEVASEAVHFAVAFLVLLVVAIPFGIFPSLYALLAIPITLVLLAFTLGVAYFFSAFNIFFRDTNKLIRYTFRIWFFLSPILYPVSAIPERFRGIYELNPFATIVPAYQAVVMDHRMPDFGALGVVAAASVAVLVLGYLFFVRLQPWFAKLV